MSDTQRDEWTVCGRVIGTATGWDQQDTFCFSLYDFRPTKYYTGPVGEALHFDFTRGVIETLNDDGEITASADLITSIWACQRSGT